MLARRPRAARRTQRAQIDGLGRVGGLGRKTRRLGDQRGWTRRRRMGKAGRCGRRAARVNWRLQCESKSATRPAQRPLLHGAASGPACPGWAVEPCEVALGCGLGRRERCAIWVVQGVPGQQSGGLLRPCSSQSCARAPTCPPLRALVTPITPTPMPAPTPDRRRHVHKNESFLHPSRDRAGIVSCRSSAGEVPLWGPQTGTRL